MKKMMLRILLLFLQQSGRVGPRKSSTNSKAEVFFTELQNLKTKEKEAYSTSISEDTPELLAFRRELDELAQKHLREVHKNKATNMSELTIFNKPQKGIFDEASYDDEGMVHDFNNLPTEVPVSPIPTFKIHNIHPQSQILGDPKSSVQTRSKVQQHSGAHALVRGNLIELSVAKRLYKNYCETECWCGEAMQEELLQFRLSTLIHWQWPQKKQTIVLPLQQKAESKLQFTSCCGQVLWIQNQMLDYGFNFMNTKIHIDNESTICIVKNPVYHSKTKHIEIRHHFIRDYYEKAPLGWSKFTQTLIVANILTKAFDGPRITAVPQSSRIHTPFMLPEARTMTVEDLLHLVPNLITKVNSLETELKQTKLTMGKAIVKLVKKVKKLEDILKRRHVVLTDSEDEEPKDQGGPKSVDKVKDNKRRKESMGKDIDSGFEDISTGFEEVNTSFEKVNTGGLRVSTGSGPIRDAIRAKLEANAELTKNVLGKGLPEEDFAKKMVELVNERKKFFAEERAQARRMKRKLKSCSLKSDTREDVSVPKEKDKESKKPESAKSGTEEDVKAYMEERVDEPSLEEFQMSSIPQGLAPAKIVKWQIIKTGKRGSYQIIREDNTDVVYVNFQGLLNDLTRDDLKKLYRLMMLKYGDNRPKEEFERTYGLVSPKQTALGKDFSNPFMVDNLPKIEWLSTHHIYVCKELASPQGYGLWIAPDYEASRARGFVLRSLELQSLASMGIQYPKSYRLTFIFEHT
ncbi:hypothetical protein Tco_0720218 [Tanacetum coccineum]